MTSPICRYSQNRYGTQCLRIMWMLMLSFSLGFTAQIVPTDLARTSGSSVSAWRAAQPDRGCRPERQSLSWVAGDLHPEGHSAIRSRSGAIPVQNRILFNDALCNTQRFLKRAWLGSAFPCLIPPLFVVLLSGADHSRVVMGEPCRQKLHVLDCRDTRPTRTRAICCQTKESFL